MEVNLSGWLDHGPSLMCVTNDINKFPIYHTKINQFSSRKKYVYHCNIKAITEYKLKVKIKLLKMSSEIKEIEFQIEVSNSRS